MNKFSFKKAERKKAKLRLALCGPAGAGKTYSALRIATGLGGKVALLDTERRSGDLYANDFEYDTCSLDEEFSPQNYIEIIKTAETNGYDILIIDSLSHAWSGEGGVLELVDKATQASNSKNSYFAWRNVTPQHNALVDTILKSKMHIIATIRTKTDYLVSEEKGKSKPIKVGLAPIQREGIDYEFTVVLDLSLEGNIATASKDRTKLFQGKNFIVTEKTGIELVEWLEDGRSQDDLLMEFLKTYTQRIESANSLDILKAVFIDGIKEARQLSDERAENELTRLKDARKKVIEDAIAPVEEMVREVFPEATRSDQHATV
jgi:hypothetical protein